MLIAEVMGEEERFKHLNINKEAYFCERNQSDDVHFSYGFRIVFEIFTRNPKREQRLLVMM